MMTTWSPVSMCGVYMVLCLPRRMPATIAAMRPRIRPCASTTYHFFVTSVGLAEYVFVIGGRPELGAPEQRAPLFKKRALSSGTFPSQRKRRKEIRDFRLRYHHTVA